MVMVMIMMMVIMIMIIINDNDNNDNDNNDNDKDNDNNDNDKDNDKDGRNDDNDKVLNMIMTPSLLYRCQRELEVVRGLLEEATTLLNEVYKANGMNRAISQQYEHLKKKVEKLKKGSRISRPNSAQRRQNEIIEDLRKELEKVPFFSLSFYLHTSLTSSFFVFPLFLPLSLPPSFLPSFLPSSSPSFLRSFIPSFYSLYTDLPPQTDSEVPKMFCFSVQK